MAVLPEIPGLEVTVQVKKSNLPEFDIPINNNKPVPSEVTKYIQSAAGSTFRLKWELKKDFLYSENDIALDVYLDGSGVVCKSLNKRFLRSLNRAPVCHYVKGAESFTGKEWIRREFIFSELTVVDASVDKPIDRQLLERIKQMGKISMMFWRVRSTGVKKAEKSTRRLNNEYDVPEKARKGEALSLKSRLGAAKIIEDYSKKCMTRDYIDPRDKPFATFNFLYRSQEDLKAMQIIPRTPSPVPLEHRPLNELTREELEQEILKQRAANRKVELTEIKTEKTLKRERPCWDQYDDDEVSFVSERPAIRRPTFDEAEAIDLT